MFYIKFQFFLSRNWKHINRKCKRGNESWSKIILRLKLLQDVESEWNKSFSCELRDCWTFQICNQFFYKKLTFLALKVLSKHFLLTKHQIKILNLIFHVGNINFFISLLIFISFDILNAHKLTLFHLFQLSLKQKQNWFNRLKWFNLIKSCLPC